MAQEISVQGNDNNVFKIEDGYSDIRPDDKIEDIKRKVIYSSSTAIQNIQQLVPVENLEQAVSWLDSANRIMFYGSGGSNVLAMDAHHKFLRLGLTSLYESNSHFAIIRAAHLNNHDVLVLFSHTGDSKEVIECAKNAQKAQCKIIG